MVAHVVRSYGEGLRTNGAIVSWPKATLGPDVASSRWAMHMVLNVDRLPRVSLFRPCIRHAAGVIALSWSLLGLVPSMVESATSPTSDPEWSGGTYTVRRGDYLYAIARATGTKLSTLLELNGLSVNSVIHPGDVLRTTGDGPPGSGGTYTVVPGDCWSCIARRFGVSTRDLLAANRAHASTMIHPGQVVDLPAGAAPAGGSPSVSRRIQAERPSASDPGLSAQLEAAVGSWRLDLAASLGGGAVRIVWDNSVPLGADAVAESTMTIRVHPRMQERSTRILHNVLAHEFGHLMVIVAVEHVLLSDPGVCHEKVADEIASRIRERIVRVHQTNRCTWNEAGAIADAVFAQGF
jgi:LysM repeat protein